MGKHDTNPGGPPSHPPREGNGTDSGDGSDSIESFAPCPVVGIGASAGGLEAAELFFGALPADPGAAFVLVAHLAPDSVSLLAELLQRTTSISVVQIVNNTKVQANHVYVIPPGHHLIIVHGTLRLVDRTGASHGRPIDRFFRSLAEDQGPNAMCVVLSGTGSDGTLGLRAVKAEGGTALVQTEGSARYDGMPRAAIQSGLADFVLPPDELAHRIVHLASRLATSPRTSPAPPSPAFLEALKKICAILRARVDHDFSHYKPDSVAEYIRYLAETPHEAQLLRNPTPARAGHIRSRPSRSMGRSATSPRAVLVTG